METVLKQVLDFIDYKGGLKNDLHGLDRTRT